MPERTIAFEYFLRKKCDIVVLEVGMGGAFDATNVIGTHDGTIRDALSSLLTTLA